MFSLSHTTNRPASWRWWRWALLISVAGLAAVFVQIPGCGPRSADPLQTIGGLRETAMADGALSPVTLRFLDNGAPAPVRVYFYQERQAYVLGPEAGYYFPIFWDRYYQDKYFPLRPGVAVLDMATEMDHHYYWLTGEATVRFVPGTYRLTAYKGLEYRPLHGEFTVGADPSTETFTLERWVDMQADGWYNGDDHIHLGRTGDENAVYLAMQEAEGLHVGHYLQLQRFWQAVLQRGECLCRGSVTEPA